MVDKNLQDPTLPLWPERLESEWLRLSAADVLAQSSDRQHFFDCAHREFELARAQGSALAFLLLDIDDFKVISDSYGQPESDVVLQRVTHCGRDSLRRGDLFGRMGSEGFAAVLPGCIPAMARQVAERLQREFQRLRFSHGEHGYGITMSQGLTSLTREDDTLDALFARADSAMDEAKRQGKNRIVAG